MAKNKDEPRMMKGTTIVAPNPQYFPDKEARASARRKEEMKRIAEESKRRAGYVSSSTHNF